MATQRRTRAASQNGSQTISVLTRQDIADVLTLEPHMFWAGGLDEVTFLAPLYGLRLLPSTDYRFKTAGEDIRQHRLNNYDWGDEWIFGDERFNLLHSSDEEFLRFVVRTVHPTVRRNADVQQTMVARINESLSADGYELYADGEISGRKIYGSRRIDSFHGDRPAALGHEEAVLGDRSTLDRHLKRIARGLGDDPEAAIGSSKELVESVLKQILDARGVAYPARDDLPALFKAVGRALDLRRGAVDDDAKASEAVVALLRGLTATVQSLAELRNRAGTGHGRSTGAVVDKRHARLALNAAVAVTEFLYACWDG